MRTPAGIRSLPVRVVQAGRPAALQAWFVGLRQLYAEAFQREVDERRLILWVPVCAGAGAVLHLTAPREPWLPFVAALTALAVAASLAVRHHCGVRRVCVAVSAILAGMSTAGLRSASLSAPVLDRIRIVRLTGYLEEIDLRANGARLVLRVTQAEGLDPAHTPVRVRLTVRNAVTLPTGTSVALTARLVPPSRAALPGGYDFGRDAFFARIGAVGNVLGAIRPVETAVPADIWLRVRAAIDNGRNALARRLVESLPGPEGAIGAAMVAGKRGGLDDATRDIIQRAGIFHIVTIAGVQMTLVAAIFFWGLRRLLALSPALASAYPIKKWAAGLAILGAVAYDIGTGSRVGTERALVMTLAMLGAVLFDRRAFSMRNLAIASTYVVVAEPEALLGASFQLSFAAVAALVAVWEARAAARLQSFTLKDDWSTPAKSGGLASRLAEGPLALLATTLCATAATASFMAYHFHELSPYVMIGNPLTLTIIEFFAVPAALLGTLLYPLGLDGWVWVYLGFGIRLVLWIASGLSALPGATLHLQAFAPAALPCLALAVICLVLWRSWPMRALAVPLVACGLIGAAGGAPNDLYVAPTGDAIALRGPDGRLQVAGRRPGVFMIEQWLRADADGRNGRDAVVALSPGGRRLAHPDAVARCDPQGCVGGTGAARIAVPLERAALAEDCARATILVTPLDAPAGCAAAIVFDRGRLAETGAVALRDLNQSAGFTTARAAGEDRPWSPAPARVTARAGNGAPAARQMPPIDDRDDLPEDVEAPFE